MTFWGDLSGISAKTATLLPTSPGDQCTHVLATDFRYREAVKLFSKLNEMFFGYFNPKNICFEN